MTKPFDEIRLLYPPHPALTWTPKDIHRIKGYIAQLKYNDWRTLIYLLPRNKIELYSRKKAKLPRYRPPETLLKSLRSLPLSKSLISVLDGGLLHHNTPRVRNTLVLWDVLVHEGRYLLGTSYGERYDLLKKICGDPNDPVILDGVKVGYRISKNLWLAPTFRTGLKELFSSATRLPEIEGLILKDQNAKLQRTYRMSSNARWQIRIRRPRIDYRF